MKQIVITILLCATAITGLRMAIDSYRPKSEEGGVIEAIKARRSIRKYTDKPVEREKLDIILECGIAAPNGMNRQEWELRVVDSKEWIDRCTAAYVKSIENTPDAERILTPDFRNMFRNATAVVFIAAPEGQYAGVNCGLLGENMILAAQELGIGSCCLGGPVRFLTSSDEGREFLESLDFSDGYGLLYAIGFGYPDEQPEAKPRDKSKIRYIE